MTHIPVACSLPTASAASQALEWAGLRSHAIASEALATGVALTFGLEVADVIDDLAAREADCCSFLQLTTYRSSEAMRLEITTEHSEARPVVAALAALAGG